MFVHRSAGKRRKGIDVEMMGKYEVARVGKVPKDLRIGVQSRRYAGNGER